MSNSLDKKLSELALEIQAIKITNLGEKLKAQAWQPISTVPLGELVICLWGHRTIGSQIYDSQHDVKYATAKYWIPMPKFPNQDGR